MRKKIVYILGLSHVGSTLIDLIIGNRSNYFGLGEIYQVIKSNAYVTGKDVYCSCGKPVDSCTFWGYTIKRFKKYNSQSITEKYQIIFDTFEEVFGENAVPVDSSKLLRPLQLLSQNPKYDIKVIYMIRDVRAWTISRFNTKDTFPNYFTKNGNYIERLRQYYGWKIDWIKWVFPFLTRLSSYFFWIWYLQNKLNKKFLLQNKVKYIQIGYDELGMQKQVILPKIHKFLGESDEQFSFSTESSKSHILVGNVKKLDPQRRKDITYDNRWIYRTEWLLSAAIYRNIMNYNNTEVYKNIRDNNIW